MKLELSRRQAREQAFLLAFERIFIEDSIEQICETARECRDFKTDAFTMLLIHALIDNEEQINELITKHIDGWKISRLSKVALSVLQLSICELLFVEDNTNAENPVGVVINEAVILAKKYSTVEDSGFVNGVLGSIAKTQKG